MRPGGDGDVKDWNDILTMRKNFLEPVSPGRSSDGFRELTGQVSAKWKKSYRTMRNDSGISR